MDNQQEPVVFINGAFVPRSQAVISAFDQGFRWGDGVYDFARTFGGKVFKLREHLERLRWSLHYTRIDPGMSMEELERVTLELVDRNVALLENGDDVSVAHFISRGLLEPTRKARGKATVVINTDPLAFPVHVRHYTKGIRLVTPATRRTPPQCLSPKAKVSNKMNHHIALFEAQTMDAEALPLMLDLDGNITESHASNFLFLMQGRLCVPNRRNVLGGIGMETFLEMAKELGIETEEGDYTPFDVYKAEEAFLTGTSYCLAPVVSLNGLKIGKGVPGPAFRKLIQVWSERVGVDILDQAMSRLPSEELDSLEVTALPVSD